MAVGLSDYHVRDFSCLQKKTIEHLESHCHNINISKVWIYYGLHGGLVVRDSSPSPHSKRVPGLNPCWGLSV